MAVPARSCSLAGCLDSKCRATERGAVWYSRVVLPARYGEPAGPSTCENPAVCSLFGYAPGWIRTSDLRIRRGLRSDLVRSGDVRIGADLRGFLTSAA